MGFGAVVEGMNLSVVNRTWSLWSHFVIQQKYYVPIIILITHILS